MLRSFRSYQSVHRWRGSMKDAGSRKFYRRVNADGTINSICLLCFLTAVRANIGSDLQELESAHQCDDEGPSILIENLRSLGR
jgi:hypothetical protein